MAIRTSSWTLLREIDISGGFTPDTDWIADNDVAAANAAGFNQQGDLFSAAGIAATVVFLDNAGSAIAPSGASATVEMVHPVESPTVPDYLRQCVPSSSISETMTNLDVSCPGRIAARVTALSGTPGGAETVRIYARTGVGVTAAALDLSGITSQDVLFNNGGSLAGISPALLGMIPTGITKIYEKDNLPAPIGGVITLPDFSTYQWLGVIDLGTDRIVGDNITFLGSGTFLTSMVSNTPNPVFSSRTSGGVLFICRSMQISNSNAAGVSVDIDLISAPVSGIFLVNCFFSSLDVSSFGFLRNAGRADIFRCGFFSGIDGVKITGNIPEIAMTDCIFEPFLTAPSWKGLEVTSSATITNMVCNLCKFTNVNASDKSVSVHSSATLNKEIRLDVCQFKGVGEFIDSTGVTQRDVGVIATNSPGIEPSYFGGHMSFNGNTTATVISSQGVFVPIGNDAPLHDLFLLDASSERFTLNAATETQNQELVYNGVDTRTFMVLAIYSTDKSGGEDNSAICITKNSVVVTGSNLDFGVSTKSSGMMTGDFVTLSTTDTVGCCISNQDSTDNLTIGSAKLLLFALV